MLETIQLSVQRKRYYFSSTITITSEYSEQQPQLYSVQLCISVFSVQWVAMPVKLTKTKKNMVRSISCQNDDFKNSVHGENPNETLAARFEKRQKFVKIPVKD